MPWASSGGCSLVGGCGGLSCLEDGLWGTWLGRWARGSRAQAQCLGHTGLVALQRVGPSRVRNRTRVPCVVGELYTTEPPGKPKGQLLFVFLFPFHFDPFNFKLLVGVQLLREAPVLAVGRSESATCVRPPRPGGSSRGSPRSFEWSPLSKVSSQRHAQTPVCGAASADTHRLRPAGCRPHGAGTSSVLSAAVSQVRETLPRSQSESKQYVNIALFYLFIEI